MRKVKLKMKHDEVLVLIDWLVMVVQVRPKLLSAYNNPDLIRDKNQHMHLCLLESLLYRMKMRTILRWENKRLITFTLPEGYATSIAISLDTNVTGYSQAVLSAIQLQLEPQLP